MAQFFRRYFSNNKDLKILDVGCGTGINLSELDSFGRVYGIDISEEAANYCRKRGHKIVKGSVMEMPFSDNSFDVVTSLGVFYHKKVGDDLQGMREICRVLKPQGRLFFFDSAMDCLYGNHDIVFHGIRRYMKLGLTSKLKDVGFQVDWVSYLNVLIFPIAYLKRRIERIIRTKPRSEARMINKYFNYLLFLVSCVDVYYASIIVYPFGLNIVAHAKKLGSTMDTQILDIRKQI